ncbi:hypothetical protein BS50DRAFT_572066 [Corynespora cassiicola Philippines]|uniref:MICOS complex subunit MIC12 n=1 Tax=Corynespora cassiicola Philippines TaxID=1448308 RepID=A0A2T2NU01_CORCC|nr:hypothetical protein BS50DRAFT_572066 [Corynespora cassiicola Philippines]
MGFTTGFLGGFTLTSAVLYLTVSLHTKNRLTQAALLRQQRTVLTSVVEPKQPEDEPRSREVPAGIAEMAKDKWNGQVEGIVKRVYETDWRRVRENVEDKLGNAVSKLKESKPE